MPLAHKKKSTMNSEILMTLCMDSEPTPPAQSPVWAGLTCATGRTPRARSGESEHWHGSASSLIGGSRVPAPTQAGTGGGPSSGPVRHGPAGPAGPGALRPTRPSDHDWQGCRAGGPGPVTFSGRVGGPGLSWSLRWAGHRAMTRRRSAADSDYVRLIVPLFRLK
jgi:hypothetical protein